MQEQQQMSLQLLRKITKPTAYLDVGAVNTVSRETVERRHSASTRQTSRSSSIQELKQTHHLLGKPVLQKPSKMLHV